jgi:RHS repeat-associated protein
MTNPRGYTTAYALTRYGQATRIEEPLGRTTKIAYDPAGHHIVDTLPSGHVMRYTWDKAGNLTQRNDATTSRTISYTYDSTYNLLTGIFGNTDAVTNWVNTISHDGHPAYSIYDSSSHAGATEQMRDTLWDLYGPTPQCVQSKPYRVEQCHPQGPQKYDATHSWVGLVNDSAVITLNQEDAGNGHPAAKVSWLYDWSGRPTRTITWVSSNQSDTTWTVYDARGRDSVVIAQLNDTLRDTTRYFYGVVNPDPDSIVDAKGQMYRVWPNALGWADSTKDPTGAVTTFHYDLNGNVDTVTPRRGTSYRVTHERDALDRDTLVVAGTDTTWFTTDPHDLFKTAKNKVSTDTIRFDAAGRKVGEITCRPVPSTISCFKDSSEYNNRDLRTKLIVSSVSSLWSARTATYYYDGLISRLDSMTNFTNERVVFGYAIATGRDSTRTFRALGDLIESFAHTPWIDGTAAISFDSSDVNLAFGSAYRYDEAQRLTQHFHGRTALPDTTRFAVLDRGGRLWTYTDERFTWDSSGADPCSVTWYGLGPPDSLTRLGETCDYSNKLLAAAVVDSGTYAYDAVGNRVDSLTQAYAATDGANRLLRLKNLRMSYDADGNLRVKRTLKADTTKFATDSLFWSALGRLDSLHFADSVGGGTTRVNYGYDGWGRLVRTDFPDYANSTENDLFDGDERIFWLNSTGAIATYTTWYPGMHERQSMAFTNASGVDTTLYFITDALHNVVGRLRSEGGSYVIESKYRYSPYGDSTILAPKGRYGMVRYKGEITMAHGLYEMGARFYDPAVGRFISEDPLGLAAGMNMYTFARNDPVNGYDPMGTCDLKCLLDLAQSILGYMSSNDAGEEGPVCSAQTKGGPLAMLKERVWGAITIVTNIFENTNSIAHVGSQGTFRTTQEQADIFKDHQAKGLTVDAPGKSCHEGGICIDIYGWGGLDAHQKDYVDMTMVANGYTRPNPDSDPNHFQFGTGYSYRKDIPQVQASVAGHNIQACQF